MTSTTHIEQECLNWLRLIRSENVGIKTFYTLISLYGTATNALKALPSLSRKGGKTSPIKICSRQAAEKEIAATHKIGGSVIPACSPDYPYLLTQTDSAPPILITLGNTNLLNQKTIAIVGARNASAAGCHFAQELSYNLGEQGIITASGLARGIDTYAHQGAKHSGTIAVIANGLNHIYPRENTKLFHHIREHGIIISEMPLNTPPKAALFPRRNRIISGISLATAVIEAQLQSGSLITAKYALEQNRDVFATPGFPGDPRCKGTNQLLKEGALLLESITDILEEIPQDLPLPQKQHPKTPAPAYTNPVRRTRDRTSPTKHT